MMTTIEGYFVTKIRNPEMSVPETVALLAQIAKVLDNLVPNSEAEPRYELMSDALIWPDEIPQIDLAINIRNVWAMRYVYHTRKQIMLGEFIEEDRRQIWNEAKKLFPRWPGFAPARSSAIYADLYYESSADLRRELDELERKLDPKRTPASSTENSI